MKLFLITYYFTSLYVVALATHIIEDSETKVRIFQKLLPVYGTRQCGGPGKLVEWRVQDCNPTDESPCKFQVDGITRRAELDFIPSENIDQLGIRILYITKTGKELAFSRIIENSSVIAGIKYTFEISGKVPIKMRGKGIIEQYNIIYRVGSGMTEICSVAKVMVS